MPAVLREGDLFGSALAPIGDLDGDRVTDLAVGGFRDDDGGWRRGAVWILFLNRDRTVKAHSKISDTHGGFGGPLRDDEGFGSGIAPLGDFDGDGVLDLAVGARRDGDGGLKRGAVWLLFLNRDGTVKAHAKISEAAGGFTGDLNDDDQFGYSVAFLGDLDGGGVPDLATGAIFDDDGGENVGTVWILFLQTDSLRGEAAGSGR